MIEAPVPIVRKSRIVLKDVIYYQTTGSQPTSVTKGATRPISSDEQPYSRRVVVDEDWKALDTGWLPEVSTVLVENVKEPRQVVPTKAEESLEKAKVLEIGIMVESESRVYSFAFVPIGESLRINPTAKLYVRCRKGSTKIAIDAFPY